MSPLDIDLAPGYLWLFSIGPLLVRPLFIARHFRSFVSHGPIELIGIASQLLANGFYNVFLHPLRHVPGPFWARASEVPSWLHTASGKRHIWLWQQFQIYGPRVRAAPNLVLFCDPAAYPSIYSMKANVRRSPFYQGLTMNIKEKTTLNTLDPAEHAVRRKMLNTCFTETSVKAVSTFISKHVDEWNQILLDENSSTTEWSAPLEFSEKIDKLVFDVMGDIAFGRSFNTKRRGKNVLGEVPQLIAKYLKFYYPMCRSPFLNFIVWLKPRGLDALIEIITPPTVQKFNEFVFDSVTQRLKLYKEQVNLPEDQRRQDMFYFLCRAEDPDTGLPAYSENDLRAEARLFIIAGSDTTSGSLASIFWYLVRAPKVYQKLVNEILTTFKTAEDITYGPDLLNCTYLRACIDEAIRMVPAGPCEAPREVLPGGVTIMGDFYPEGTIVGTLPWCDARNDQVYGDPTVFRPERWIVDEASGVTKEKVAEIRANFHPFLAGPGSCAGKNVALAEIMLVVAKTLHRLDFRKAPGSTLGEGRYELGWGARDPHQFQIQDAFISLKHGPEIQFRKRTLM